MAQPGNFTPILLYSSSTAAAVPLAANLTNSTNGAELAINIADKNLFFKDSGGVVNTVPIRQSSTSSNGWLSSTDWNTFNGKAPATSGTSILYGNGSGGFSNVTIGSGITFAGGTLSATGSGGTVTSVTGTSPVVSSGGTTPAISLATAYGDTLNPYASKTANYVLAAPNGSAGVPTFRALVAADLPSLSGTYIPYTGASSAIDLNAQTVTNIAHLGLNSTAVPDILFRAYGDNNSTSRIAIRGYSSNASSSSIRVAKFRGTFASPQAPLSGDSLGKFELAGYGTTSSSGYPQASYEGVATENWGATARGTKALFYTTPNTTTTQTLALTLNQDQTATFVSSVTATSFIGSGSSLTGVVTSVTGTSPVVSSGGTTPAISMPAATTSVSGYLTSTDWNTFNNKGSGTVTSVSGTTGRITSTGGATPVIDLTSGVATAGTTGSSTLIPVVTIDTYGRVTSITTASNPQGTVTSVTGTAPVVSSGGATPAISMAAATGSVNGYLTSTDWTTFNNKGSGSVTSVAASVPAFLSISGSPITTSGTLAITLSGTALPVANGGTGLTSLTAGYVPYGNGTSAFASSSNFYYDGSNLGVGTTSTSLAKLTVKGGNAGNLLIDNDNSQYTQLLLQRNSTANTGADILIDGTNSLTYLRTLMVSPLIFSTSASAGSPTEKMRITTAGLVGIGTNSPAALLDTQQSTTDMVGVSILNTNNNVSVATSSQIRIGITNSVGVSYAVIKAQEGSGDDYPYLSFGVQNAVTTTPTERMRIASNGIITMSAYGAGAATFSASGVISSVSDETWKIKDGVPINPDAMLQKLEAGYWFYNEEKAPIFGKDRQLGFYAQNVHEAIGIEAAPIPEEGKPWGYYDRSVLAITVMSLKNALKTIQELNDKFDAYVASHP
jgi:hypothetical protein